MKTVLVFLLWAAGLGVGAGDVGAASSNNPVVRIAVTNNSNIEGVIVLELYAEEAPITVENFLAYMEEGFYDGLIFHRVIDGFVVQGGGFDTNLVPRETLAPILNESNNGLKNVRGSVAMARTTDPNSATSQFYINLVDNDSLDYESPDDVGYCVFGRVVKGMEVVDAIAETATRTESGMANVPVVDVISEQVESLGELAIGEPNITQLEVVGEQAVEVRIEAFGIYDDDAGDPQREFEVTYYLSDDPDFSPVDSPGGMVSESTQQLTAEGANFSGTGTFVAPSEPGEYYLVVGVTDAGSGAANSLNTWSQPVQVSVDPNAPDLIVADPNDTSLRVGVGEEFTLPFAIENVGGVAAEPEGTIRVGLYRHGEAEFVMGDPGNELVGSFSVATVAAGGTASGEITFVAPGEVGRYYLTAVADDEGQVAEYDETNNFSEPVELLTEPDMADLVVTFLNYSPPDNVFIEAYTVDTINVRIKIENHGHADAVPNDAAAGIVTVLYLSAEADLSDAQEVTRYRQNNLAEGAEKIAQLSFAAPDTPGVYYLFAVTDDGGQVPELNEQNNESFSLTLTLELEPQEMGIRSLYALAGARDGEDTFMVSGTFDPNLSALPAAEPVRVRLGLYEATLPRSGFRQLGTLARYWYTGVRGGITFGLLDLKNGTFYFYAQGVDLTGLSAPAEVEIQFGAYRGMEEATEDVINGPANIPMAFMRGYEDTLRVIGGYIHRNPLTGRQSLRLQGEIAAADTEVDLSDEAVTIKWGTTFTQTISAGQFRRIGSMYYYANPQAQGTIALAQFDLERCTFYLTIREAALNASAGPASFRVQFDEFDETAP